MTDSERPCSPARGIGSPSPSVSACGRSATWYPPETLRIVGVRQSIACWRGARNAPTASAGVRPAKREQHRDSRDVGVGLGVQLAGLPRAPELLRAHVEVAARLAV